MKEEIEYQIYIGCKDSATNDEIVSEEQLRRMVASYFEKKEIDFSMLYARGGYLMKNGEYVLENTLSITIISAQGLDIEKLGKSLSMYMNQECILVSKTPLSIEYR